eukprot:scaffold1686_cov371-Prasinococcus_capsulatus_cf.AAC.7
MGASLCARMGCSGRSHILCGGGDYTVGTTPRNADCCGAGARAGGRDSRNGSLLGSRTARGAAVVLKSVLARSDRRCRYRRVVGGAARGVGERDRQATAGTMCAAAHIAHPLSTTVPSLPVCHRVTPPPVRGSCCVSCWAAGSLARGYGVRIGGSRIRPLPGC